MRMNRADAGLAVLAATVLLWLAASPKAPAQAVAMTSLEIGSRVVASIEPPVPRPVSKPCVVTLFAHKVFDDHGNGSSMAARPHRFHFAPPGRCDGIWSKVVLEVDFRVPAGRQFDRTASIWLGGV